MQSVVKRHSVVLQSPFFSFVPYTIRRIVDDVENDGGGDGGDDNNDLAKALVKSRFFSSTHVLNELSLAFCVRADVIYFVQTVYRNKSLWQQQHIRLSHC